MTSFFGPATRFPDETLDLADGEKNLRGDRVLTLGQVRADDEAMFRLFFLLAPACFFFVSCQQSVIHPESTVVVKDVRIPSEMPWYSRFASHSFVDYRETPSSPWRRLEIANKSSGIVHEEISSEEAEATERWGNPIHLVSQSKTDGVKFHWVKIGFCGRLDSTFCARGFAGGGIPGRRSCLALPFAELVCLFGAGEGVGLMG